MVAYVLKGCVLLILFTATENMNVDRIGCYNRFDNGTSYYGPASSSSIIKLPGDGFKTCLKWNDVNSPNWLYRADNNYCHNQDAAHFHQPWCYTNKTTLEYRYCNIPICGKPCPPLQVINMNDLQRQYRYPESISVSCKEGYETISNDPARCTADGTWSRIPQCRGKPCPPLQVINMNDLQRQYRYPESISVSCKEGYETISNDPARCTADGTWSRIPQCRGKMCQPLNVPNSTLPHREYRYPANITVSCEVGYKIDSSDPLLCTTYGGWSRVPKCIGITCPPLQVTNMNDLKKHYHYPESFTVSCKDGYESVSYEPVHCTDNGSWSRRPQCRGIQCNPFPKITHGLNTKAFYRYSDLVTTECEPGYKLNTSKPIGCLTNGEWTKPLPVCVEDIADPLPQYGPVIGGAVGGTVALVVVVIVVVIIIRGKKINRKNNESATYNIPIQQENKAQDSVYDEIGKKDDTYYNIQNEEDRGDHYAFIEEPQLPKTAVFIDDFYDYVEKRRNTGGEIEAEFGKFKNGLQHATTEALRPGNKAKNKHKNFYPYDDTRVVLKKKMSSLSDYINASFINGYGEVNKYIAAQGPFGNTVDDFWEMVYQFDCGKIVMLTNVLEDGKEKCIIYWPETIGSSATFGSVKVIMTKEEIFSDFTTRTLKLHQEGKEKIIKQFHFTAWPYKDVPKYPSTLVHFRYKVNAYKSTLSGPIVVHCSAGIGRTGTYIAVDYVVAEASAVGYVDVYGCVEGLRRQRVNMVQTVKEYAFLHETVLDALSSGPA